MEPMLKVTDLRVNYGHIEALRGVSIEVQKGQIVSIIGANGAGKSTLLRTISGLVKPLGGIFGIYELFPAFLFSCLCIVVVSLLTAKPEREIEETFEQVRSANP